MVGVEPVLQRVRGIGLDRVQFRPASVDLTPDISG